MNTYIVVGLGAFIGAGLRYFVSTFFSTTFPYSTLIVNVLGSTLAGIFIVLIVEYKLFGEHSRLFFIIGFCGSLTTMSTFGVDTIRLFEADKYLYMAMNIFFNLVLSVGFLFLAMILTRNLVK